MAANLALETTRETTANDIATDEQILEEARAGNRNAFGEIVRRWERRIFALAYGMLGSVEDARDATQETFFAAYRNIGNFRGEARVSSWLHRIAVNQCITRTRRTKARPEVELETVLENQLASVDSHASSVEQDERSKDVRAAIATLPVELRQIVVMKEFEEMTFQEISNALDVPLSTVKSRLYTALKQLQMKLARHGESLNSPPAEHAEKVAAR
ncbi:MAG: sigma-70 family RNA polymerase sigma factor [Pyrinomonadaceae bacterium MAG19_C2-C3]|nr:sigma-70 family RNA polymerase sigma factor [Pyrinomonadaceae bacterium MAG19_C2-C3]